MVELPPLPPLKTDDAARRIEYVLKMGFTAEQRKDVCSILRLYRHEAIMSAIRKVEDQADDSVKG